MSATPRLVVPEPASSDVLAARYGISKLIVPPLQGSTKLVSPSIGSSGITYDGSIPEITANDPAGFARAQMGNLPNYTDPNGLNSPAQWGFRALDASGNNIFDSLGLMAVMKSLGITDVGSNTFSSTTFSAVPNTAIAINLTRTVNLLALILTTGKVSAGTNNGLIRCNLVGVGTSGNMFFGPPNFITLMGWRFFPAVPAGAYTLQLEGAVDVGGTTLSTTESALQVFQLGA